MAKLRITYAKSTIGYSKDQKATVRSLGLRKLQAVVVKDDNPSIRGMLFKVRHLVRVEEVADDYVEPVRVVDHQTRVLSTDGIAAPTFAAAAPPVAVSVLPELPAEPEAVTEAAPVPAPADRVPAAAAADQLELIEGIGPKIAALLHQAGIRTFRQLAATDEARLQALLDAAGLAVADPATWAEQAAFAAAARWDELKALQEQLTGGRRDSLSEKETDLEGPGEGSTLP
jgi:ribosomal protein L30